MSTTGLESRAAAYAALGDPSRLAVAELLANGDLASGELGRRLDIPSNLLAHHLHVLEEAGLIERHRSEGDGRRTYVARTPSCNDLIGGPGLARPRKVAFICSQNSARSQLAETFWRTVSDVPVVSGGTHPASRVHPLAVAAARRHGLDLTTAHPRLAADVLTGGELVITVCDRAYEELDTAPLHWSIPDPARGDDQEAFDAAYDDIARRITRLTAGLAAG
ncbi:MAG TPA: helix-turn-helix domain-containing protein [Propionicimonas sp.]|jgi:protein-tyrosine-phosphatase|uniref:arsenate reductase/protein-tyrosine-phosphatase family protein n=1 Tax=Propionicimonas sp. TaxID=1955623 RepID=UPI002F40B265